MAYKIFVPIHLAPVLLFKRNQLKRHPLKVLKALLKNIIRSTAWISVYVCLLWYFYCFFRKLRQKTDKYNINLAASVCWIALYLDSANRRTEMALYMIPRMFESGLSFLENFGYIKSPPNAEVLAFAIGPSLLMYFYQNESKNIRQTYRNLFQKYWGDD